MTEHGCVRVLDVLGAYGPRPEALFVGGCVRNLLLDRPVADLDIATTHHPLQVIEKLKAAGIRYVPTGLEHGTVTAIVDNSTFEITTLRKDIETDGRHAVIAFSTDWAEDAQRRDFTINTLLAAPDGAIYDPTGQGLDDLEARRVRFVGNASQRVQEDYLRIFRFFRFYAQYGEGEPDATAMAACAAHADRLTTLSRERVTQEFMKIMAAPDPSTVLVPMVTHKITPYLEKSFHEKNLRDFCHLQLRHDAMDIMARLFMISDMRPDFFNEWLILSNAQKKYLETLAQGMDILKRPARTKLRELVYRVGNRMAVQVYLLRLTQNGDLPDLDLLDIARYWQAPVFPVKAEQLIEAGIQRGPALGKRLKDLEKDWIKSDFSNSPEI